MVDKLFGGSPALLLTQLVNDDQLSAEDIKRLRRLLTRRLADAEGDA